MMVTNVTTVSGFLLQKFADTQELQMLQALLFLVMDLLGLAGNFIIITITTLDPQLQSPMYYFLRHLSLLDLSSPTVPQSIHDSPTDSGYISYAQCVLQVFFFITLAGAEVAILTVMSYDCYVAIFLPLHYEGIMSSRKCRWAVTVVWISRGISGNMHTETTFCIRFCRAKIIHQFFCDVPQLFKLSCSNEYLGVFERVAFVSSLGFACFIAITLSYVQIFSTVLRMPSVEGRSKVFSTCLSHLLVVSFFTSTGAFAYLKPTSDSPNVFGLMLSIIYTVLPPTLNPVIYSLRTKAMKRPVWNFLLSGELTKQNLF